jgi:hypothetical protein
MHGLLSVESFVAVLADFVGAGFHVFRLTTRNEPETDSTAHRSRDSTMSVSWPRSAPNILSPSTLNTAER